MKKIITRIFLGILSVVVIVGVGAYAFLFSPEKPTETKRPTVTDTNGNVYIAVYGETGETYAAVTDDMGNIYAAEFDDKGNIGNNVADLNDKLKLEDIPKNYDGPKVDETVSGNAYTGQAIVIEDTTGSGSTTTTAPSVTNVSEENSTAPTKGTSTTAPSVNTTKPSSNTTVTTQSTTVPNATAAPTQGTTAAPQSAPSSQQTSTPAVTEGTTSPQKPTAYKIEKYQKIFASETYFMEFTTNDEDLGDTPIVAAAKNGNVLVEASVEGIACKILYKADTDTTYIILDNWRKYSKLPPELMGEDFDMNELNMGANFASDIKGKDIQVKTVEIGGKVLTCESYYTDKGVLMEYYFDGDSFVRLDSTAKDGTVSSTYITKLTTDVPDSTFEIPDGYGYINLSWLSMMGQQ